MKDAKNKNVSPVIQSIWTVWNESRLIDTLVFDDRIELVYKQSSVLVTRPLIPPKIFKVVYSCKKGKWHQSEKIEGSYRSASDETYEF